MTQGILGAAYRKLASPQQYIDPKLIADWEWATVTSVSPLRVRRDGDSSASGTPASLVGVGSLTVNDRVMTVIVKGSLIVIGRYGGVTQRRTITNVTAPDTTSLQSASFNMNATPVAAASYPRRIVVVATVSATVSADADWRLRLGYGDDTDVADPDTVVAEQPLNNTGASNARMGCTIVGVFDLAANAGTTVRLYAARAAGNLTPLNPAGNSLQIVGEET